MTAHTHHLPGRLRLRFSQLRQQRGLLGPLVGDLRQIHGVGSVEGNPITGGILIHYDKAAANQEAFWRDVEAVLLAHHLQHDPRPLGRRADGTGVATRVGHQVADRVAKALLDKLIERSAVALVAALL